MHQTWCLREGESSTPELNGHARWQPHIGVSEGGALQTPGRQYTSTVWYADQSWLSWDARAQDITSEVGRMVSKSREIVFLVPCRAPLVQGCVKDRFPPAPAAPAAPAPRCPVLSWVADFLREKDTFRKHMEIVEDFVDNSYNNNRKPWNSSMILRGNVQRYRICPFCEFFFVHRSGRRVPRTRLTNRSCACSLRPLRPPVGPTCCVLLSACSLRPLRHPAVLTCCVLLNSCSLRSLRPPVGPTSCVLLNACSLRPLGPLVGPTCCVSCSACSLRPLRPPVGPTCCVLLSACSLRPLRPPVGSTCCVLLSACPSRPLRPLVQRVVCS